MAIACPIDSHTDKIQKVSGEVAGGIEPVLVQGEYAYRFHEQSSELVKKLALLEPEKPSMGCVIFLTGAFALNLFCALLFVDGVMLLAFVSEFDWGGLLGILCLNVIILSIMFGVLAVPVRRYTKYKAAMRVWRAQKPVWDLLYYCARHDVVFNPGTGEMQPPSSMKELLPLT